MEQHRLHCQSLLLLLLLLQTPELLLALSSWG
jgi:hypothetical protein